MTGVALARFTNQRVYLDVNVFIYAIEEYEKYISVSKALLSEIDRGSIRAVTSELSLAETLVHPLKQNRPDRVSVYEGLLRSRISFDVVPVSRVVLRRAAELRATHGNKLPDAIHVATAALASCGYFISEDAGLKMPPGILHTTLTELIATSKETPA